MIKELAESGILLYTRYGSSPLLPWTPPACHGLACQSTKSKSVIPQMYALTSVRSCPPNYSRQSDGAISPSSRPKVSRSSALNGLSLPGFPRARTSFKASTARRSKLISARTSCRRRKRRGAKGELDQDKPASTKSLKSCSRLECVSFASS